MVRTLAFALALAMVGGPALAAGMPSDDTPPLAHPHNPPPGSYMVVPVPGAGADAAADFDPFAGPNLKPGNTMPALACMPKEKFSIALAAHGGSELVTLSPTAGAFYRGFYSAQAFTAPGYPIGDKVEIAVKATTDEDGAATLEGVAVFALGDHLVCNRLALKQLLLDQIWQAGGALPKGSM